MFKKLGLAALLLFAGSANALPIVIEGTVNDAANYWKFRTGGLGFKIDVFADGFGTGGMEDAEMWMFRDTPTTKPRDLDGPVAGPGATVPIFTPTPGLYDDSVVGGPCDEDSIASYPLSAPIYSTDPCAIIPAYDPSGDSTEVAPGDYWLVIAGYIFTEDEARHDNWQESGDNGGDYRLTITGDFELIPEPSILALFGFGFIGMVFATRRKKL